MSVAEKQITIAQNVPKVFNAGYEKGKAEVIPAKEEQEKEVTINKNGTTEVLPDDGKVISKVNVEVDVPSDDSLAIGLIQRDITEVVIPDGVTEIGQIAFANCANLKFITIPDSVTYLKSTCFTLTGLTEIIFPKSVTFVGAWAFRTCNSLTKVYIPNSIIEFNWGGGLNSFDGCKKLEFVEFENGFNAKNLYLSSSTLYSVETIVSWGEALFDRTGLDPYTLTIGSKNIEKLSDEQKLIFTDKNWILK